MVIFNILYIYNFFTFFDVLLCLVNQTALETLETNVVHLIVILFQSPVTFDTVLFFKLNQAT